MAQGSDTKFQEGSLHQVFTVIAKCLWITLFFLISIEQRHSPVAVFSILASGGKKLPILYFF